MSLERLVDMRKAEKICADGADVERSIAVWIGAPSMPHSECHGSLLLSLL